MTQPALSRSGQALEAELRVALIDRVGKRNEFTQFGKTVVARARQVAHEADELKRSAVLLREGAMGSVQIGLSSGPAALLMVPLLKFMANAYPAVHLSLVQGPIAMQVAALHDKALGTLASARAALDAGLLVNLPMAMPLLSSARYALVSLLGRTEPPALNIVRSFVVDQIVDCSTYQPPLSE